MTTRSRFLCAAACGAMLVSGCNASEPQSVKPQSDPRPAAVVSKPGGEDAAGALLVTVQGKQFTRGMAVEMIREQAMRQGVPPQYAEQYIAQGGDALMRKSVDQFIDQTLMQAETDRRAEAVTEAEIETVISRLSRNLPPNMSLTNALVAQGMTMAKLREQIVTGERMRKLFDAEAPATNTVSDADVAAFYKENEKRFTTEESAEARHILIACPTNASVEARAAAKAGAESVRTQLVAGADFAGLAAATSSCPSKARGGSLGQVRRGQMVPEFEKAAFTQEVGAIGPVVETQFGYHVVQVTKRQAAGVTPLPEVSDKIREFLKSQAREKRFGAYLKTLRATAAIVYPNAGKDAGNDGGKDVGKDAGKPPERK